MRPTARYAIFHMSYEIWHMANGLGLRRIVALARAEAEAGLPGNAHGDFSEPAVRALIRRVVAEQFLRLHRGCDPANPLFKILRAFRKKRRPAGRRGHRNHPILSLGADLV